MINIIIDIGIIIKLIILYLTIIITYYVHISNMYRYVITSLIYICSIYIFNINYKLGFIYILIAILISFTEYIFIKYIKESWDYRNPNLGKIPIWLFPLCGVAIVAITQTIDVYNNFSIDINVYNNFSININ